MKTVYKSKVALWLIAVVYFPLILTASSILMKGVDWSGLISLSLILVFVSVILFGMRYIITEKELLIKVGPFTYNRYNLCDLISIRETRTVASSPAASMDRLLLQFRSGEVVVSPNDKEAFIAQLNGFMNKR